MLPIWLSPTQVRVVPVAERHLGMASEIAGRIRSAGIRADLDDRDESVGKKVRDAAMEWVPYVVVIGDAEMDKGILTVTVRARSQPNMPHKETMTEDVLIELVQEETAGQFQVEDHRTTDEVLKSVCESGYIPSFCTACYRRGRTGDNFMPLAKSGEIQNLCQPNAILTFKEFLLDYASKETREIGEETIKKHLDEIPNPKIRKETMKRLKKLEEGERDLYI